jgi:hypothetical protein
MPMRRRLAALVLLALAACQQPGASGTAPVPNTNNDAGLERPEMKEPEGLRYFPSEGKAVREQMFSRLVDACFATMSDRTKFEGCFRDRLVEAFDDSGKGKSSCADNDNIDAFAECVVVGNTILDVRRRLNDTTPLSASFWSSKDEMVKTFVKSILIHGSRECGGEATDSAQMTCLDRWMEQQLEMPSALLGRCPKGLDNPDRQACFGEAIGLRYIQDHVPRIGGVGT